MNHNYSDNIFKLFGQVKSKCIVWIWMATIIGWVFLIISIITSTNANKRISTNLLTMIILFVIANVFFLTFTVLWYQYKEYKAYVLPIYRDDVNDNNNVVNNNISPPNYNNASPPSYQNITYETDDIRYHISPTGERREYSY